LLLATATGCDYTARRAWRILEHAEALRYSDPDRPVKKDQMSWYIPVVPGVEIGFSLKYHFSPKAKVQNIPLCQ